jgi:hypothetical protein
MSEKLTTVQPTYRIIPQFLGHIQLEQAVCQRLLQTDAHIGWEVLELSGACWLPPKNKRVMGLNQTAENQQVRRA